MCVSVCVCVCVSVCEGSEGVWERKKERERRHSFLYH